MINIPEICKSKRHKKMKNINTVIILLALFFAPVDGQTGTKAVVMQKIDSLSECINYNRFLLLPRGESEHGRRNE